MDERKQNETSRNGKVVLLGVNDASANKVSVSKLVDDDKRAEPPPYGQKRRAVLTFVLIVVNMVNYMDRNTVSAVLDDVKEYFQVSDTSMGLVRTLFVLTLTISVILFGYLGDRLNRLFLLTVGLLVWAAVVLSVVFLSPSCFPIFVICRMLVGVGEGSVSTVAPAMISDMFKGRARSILFACFSLMIPVGAGIGYVVYALLGKYFSRWQNGFYFSPVFSIFSVIIIWTVIRKDPPRGKAEGASINSSSRSSLLSDLRHILGRKTFMLLSIGHTLQLFVVGAVLFWTPDYIERSPDFLKGGWRKGDGAVYFGICTMSGGLAGVAVGGTLSSFLKKKGSTLVSDAYICAGSSLFAAPLFFFGMQFSDHSIVTFFVVVFLVVTCISTNWSVMMDASMYVIHPRCRSLANGIQLLITKIGGEAWSAYVIGFISEWCQERHDYKGFSGFYCLHHALYLCCFVLIIGGFISACASWYIDEDKKFIEDMLKQESGIPGPLFLKKAADPDTDSPESQLIRRRVHSMGYPHHRLPLPRHHLPHHLPLDLPLDIPLDDSLHLVAATENPRLAMNAAADSAAAAADSAAAAPAMDGPTDEFSPVISTASRPVGCSLGNCSAAKTVVAGIPTSVSSPARLNEEKVCPVVEFAAKRVQIY